MQVQDKEQRSGDPTQEWVEPHVQRGVAQEPHRSPGDLVPIDRPEPEQPQGQNRNEAFQEARRPPQDWNEDEVDELVPFVRVIRAVESQLRFKPPRIDHDPHQLELDRRTHRILQPL